MLKTAQKHSTLCPLYATKLSLTTRVVAMATGTERMRQMGTSVCRIDQSAVGVGAWGEERGTR